MEEKTKTKKDNEIQIPVKTLVILSVIVLIAVTGFFLINSGTLNSGNKKKAEKNLINFLGNEFNENDTKIISSSKQGSFYEFILEVDREQFPVYVTTDGKFVIVDMIPLE